jgi:hypothetical protein
LALSAALGEPVRYMQIPWQAMREQSENLYLMYDWFERQGYSIDIADVRKLHPDVLDFRTWLARGSARPLTEQRAAQEG